MTAGPPSIGEQVESIRLHAGPLAIEVLTYGAHLVGVWAPDREGRVANLVASLRDELGRVQLHRYEDPRANPHLGGLVGRYANRLGGARFPLHGRWVQLVANEGSNQLHGGPVGLDRHVWSATCTSDGDGAQVELRHRSPDGDQGHPGSVEVVVVYRVDTAGRLLIDMEATTDRTTVLSLTTHSYWNLAGIRDGTARSIEDHELRVDATHHLDVDEALVPTGELVPVDGGVFDLRTPVRLGDRLHRRELAATGGYDHCLVLGPSGRAELADPASARRMTLRTDQVGLQLYTANHGAGDLGPHRAVCLESQAFPDAPNHPGFPSTTLRPGETYRHRHHLTFAVDR